MTHIIAVSKPTKNVLTATDPNDFIFHSDYNTLKYDTQGTIAVVTNKADYYHLEPGSPPIFPDSYYHYTVGEISHNLGYVPYFAGYILEIPFVSTACQAPFAYGDFIFFIYLAVYADATKLYFTVHFNSTDNSGNITTDFSYRIFKNDLGL